MLSHHVWAGGVLYDFIVHALVSDVVALNSVEFIIMTLDYELPLHAQSIECVVVPDHY